MSFETYIWVATTISETLPSNTLYCGNDTNMDPIYVGRMTHEKNVLPAKIIPHKKGAYAAFGDQEVSATGYEVLIGNDFDWKFDQNGNVPATAILGGQSADGEPLYIGRVVHNNALTVGKIQPSDGCLYISYDGRVQRYDHYEVLIEPEFDYKAESVALVRSPSPSVATTNSSDNKCCVCLDKPFEMVAISCGHLCMCEACNKNYRDKLCPICRHTVISWLKTYT